MPETSLPDLGPQAEFCGLARQSGIDSLLVDFGFAKPDPIVLAAALGLATEDVKFIVAYRSGLICPVSFVQQLNTLSALIGGRFSLNIVAGHSPQEQRSYGDHLAHDERYARTEEFLAICHAFWRGEKDIDFEGRYYRIEKGNLGTPFVSDDRRHPEIFIAGNSEAARRLAITQGTCWMRLGDTVEEVRRSAESIRGDGVELGLRMSVIVRPTREEAVGSALRIVEGMQPDRPEPQVEHRFVRRSDSVMMNDGHRLSATEWLSPTLWTGAVRSHGAPAIALVGSPSEVADAIMEYRDAGVSQFIFSGWPKAESMAFFGRAVLPLIRQREGAEGRPGLA
jgi:alkanesulfonate monooxygenase